MRPSRFRPARLMSAAACALPVLALLGLAIVWSAGRLRNAETPRWDERAFTALRVAPGAAPGWEERWVVAVYPACPHCRVSLASLAAARDHAGGDIRVTALIVDAPGPPPDSILERMTADETRWDASGRWRRRWGHRVYGEVLCFDAAGALQRVLPPLMNESEAHRRLVAYGLEALPE